MGKDTNSLRNKPRNLGEEWENWNENSEGENSKPIKEGSTLFMTIFTFLILIEVSFLSMIYYLIHPISSFFYWIYIGVITLITIYYILLTATIYLKKPFAFFLKEKQIANSFTVRIILFIGKKLGFSTDQLLHSMLEVGNTLTKTLYSPVEKNEILVLIPRCLSRQIREDLKTFTNSKGITCRIASGGTQARDILKDTRPKAIVAVACERDLYAGVKDVPPKIPVISISNSRPEGPCKNTIIDLEKLKEAVEFFDSGNN